VIYVFVVRGFEERFDLPPLVDPHTTVSFVREY